MPGWKNIALLAILCFCGWQLFTRAGCELWVSRPKPVAIVTEPIDLVSDPLQTDDNLPGPIQVERPHGSFTLTPAARYKISGLVVSIKRYYMDWESFLAPIDVGFAWGDTILPQNLKDLSFDHGNRFLHWHYRPTLQLSQLYLIAHTSNNHLIAANPTITRAIETLRVGDKATLEGYLVNVSGTAESRPIIWRTSLVRTDTGGGACEVIYVERVRIGDEVFE
jgi:hypothetical protein